MKRRRLRNAEAPASVRGIPGVPHLPGWRYPVAVIVERHHFFPACRCFPALALCLTLPVGGQTATTPAQVASTSAAVEDAVRYQLEDMHHPAWSLRYRLHRVDSKEDTVRDLIESKDGNVARTLQRHGRPLTPEEDAAERERLRSLTSEGLAKHRHSSESADRYGADMVSALPRAMVYTQTAGQPQLPQFDVPQVVLDFSPRPGFQPATSAQSLLTGLAGRVWIDADSHHLLRIEVTVIRNLNLAMGLLARVYPNGTLVYEQHAVEPGRYAYTHIEINVTLRELMFKTVPYHSTLDATAITLLPAVPSLPDAVNMLLSGHP